jgi:hypothetical protein
MSMVKENAKMTGHVCVAVKGPPPNWRAEYAAQGADINMEIHEGSLISLNAEGKFVLGCPAGEGFNRPMPMWSCKDIANAGVIQYGGNVFAGNYHGLVATGGYEIETSEFDAAATYKVNDMLMPGEAGKVTVATGAAYGAFPVVGVVSTAVDTNRTCACKTLRFWSTFIPAAN